MLYVLDTNAVSAVMADHPKVSAKLSQLQSRVATCEIVRGVIRYGLERLPQGKRRTNLEAKARLVFAALPVEPITETIAETYGVIRWDLQRAGHGTDDNDIWIAASALSIGATLVTKDHVFSFVSGLLLEDWTK